ncbi:MAG: hypothetical protein WBL20_15090 [Sphingobium sp.]|uniref:hypothetical protein n=1 Tax=Sphingobium sp. TaxID=1912891 RepID=UPI002E22C32B
MPRSFTAAVAETQPFAVAYRPGRGTPCPACGERQWLVGRIMAECAFCETALPLDLGYRGWLGLRSPTAA